MKRLLILIGFIAIATISQAQKAKLTGKITSTKNEARASVSLTLKSDKTQIAKTDIEGRYSFTIDVAKNYTLVLTYVGYKNKTVQDIKATTAGEDLAVDVVLEDVDGFNALIDPIGDGGGPSAGRTLGYVFQLNDQGLPILNEVLNPPYSTWTDGILARFLFQQTGSTGSSGTG